MNIRVESIVTATTSTVAAAALIGIVVLVINLSSAVEVSQALQQSHLKVEEDTHTMFAAELLNHASRIGTLETRTAVIESKYGKFNLEHIE